MPLARISRRPGIAASGRQGAPTTPPQKGVEHHATELSSHFGGENATKATQKHQQWGSRPCAAARQRQRLLPCPLLPCPLDECLWTEYSVCRNFSGERAACRSPSPTLIPRSIPGLISPPPFYQRQREEFRIITQYAQGQCGISTAGWCAVFSAYSVETGHQGEERSTRKTSTVVPGLVANS